MKCQKEIKSITERKLINVTLVRIFESGEKVVQTTKEILLNLNLAVEKETENQGSKLLEPNHEKGPDNEEPNFEPDNETIIQPDIEQYLEPDNLLNCEQITEAQPESNIEPNPGTDDQIEYQRKDYKCESCGKSFSQACDLKKHI